MVGFLVDIFRMGVSSSFPAGGCIGGFIGGILADKLGRKGAILFNNIFVIIGIALMTLSYWANQYYLLIIGRFFIGINAGMIL